MRTVYYSKVMCGDITGMRGSMIIAPGCAVKGINNNITEIMPSIIYTMPFHQGPTD